MVTIITPAWSQLFVKELDQHEFSSVQLLSRVRLFVTPRIAVLQASLSTTNSQSLLKLMSIESVEIQPFHPLSSPFPPAPNPSQHQGLFQWVNSSHEVAKYWSFSLSISPSNEHPGFTSFRMDWLDLLAVQGTLKSLLQHHNSEASIFRHSALFTVQLSHPIWTDIGFCKWILECDIPKNKMSLVGYSSWGRKESDMTEHKGKIMGSSWGYYLV